MKSGNDKSNRYDYLIIGAGPAGLQLGYYLEKAKRNYLILEVSDGAGSFFRTFPRHRKLISINKVYTGYDDREINLRWDWNSLLSDSDEMLFKNYSGSYFPDADDLIRYLNDFARYFNLKIKYGVRVTRITRSNGFEIADSQGNTYTCKVLIIATGVSNAYVPKIPGVEFAERYGDVSVNPRDFTNQRVLIIGKGNSGFETADNLIETTGRIHIVSETPISMAWTTKYVGHLRATNNNFLDTYQLKSQNVIIDARIMKIERENGEFVVTFDYVHAPEQEDLRYDRVILCTGFRFDTSIFDESCVPALVCNGRLPDQTSEYESTNVKDLYFAGTLMQMRDYKKKQSAFIHGFRYNVHALYHILEKKYRNKGWPSRLVASNPRAMMEAIVHRVNGSSGLWQQTGYIGDVVAISGAGKPNRYYSDIPVDYAHEFLFATEPLYYVVTTEFGLERIQASPDPFALDRMHKDDADLAAQSTAIHPIVRGFVNGHLISEHHVIEDIAAEWKEDVHTRPLMEFFSSEASKLRATARARA